MAKCFIQDSTLTSIANAIRAKTGGTDLMLPSAMPAAIEGIVSGGGAGQYVWSKQYAGSTATEDTTGGTYTLTTANDTRPSSEIEYSATSPTYNAETKKWEMTDSTIVTLTNEDTTVPSFSENMYVRLTSAPNIWYLATAINTGGTGPYIKSLAYDAMYTADIDSSYVEYVTGETSDEYPDGGWSEGAYCKLELPLPDPYKGITWSDGTDEEIVAMVAAADAGEINLSDYWSVGDERSVTISAIDSGSYDVPNYDAQNQTFVLMNVGGYELANGKECNFVVGQKQASRYSFNGWNGDSQATNQGGWDSTVMRQWCNDKFRNAIPSGLQGIFKQFKCQATSGNSSTNLTTSLDYFSFPSEFEVLGSITRSPIEEGPCQFEYYKTEANRKKGLSDDLPTSYNDWALRSPSANSSTSFVYISRSGSPFGTSSDSNIPFSPFGCI